MIEINQLIIVPSFVFVCTTGCYKVVCQSYEIETRFDTCYFNLFVHVAQFTVAVGASTRGLTGSDIMFCPKYVTPKCNL